MSLRVVLAAALFLAAGCDIRPFIFQADAAHDPRADAGGGTGGTGGLGGAGGTGGAGADDGGIGDGGSADACSPDLQNDPANCGRCGNVCSYANANPVCNLGTCQMGACLPGFHDLDGNSANGCEYACTVTNMGVEICDGLDNDCNGVVDDPFDLTRDVNNCGMCGNRCTFAHAVASCVSSTCRLGACDPGYRNANGVDADGCECRQTNGGVEICDGIDNDCNGIVDDVAPSTLAGDPQHCGSCANNCLTLPHAQGGCMSSMCYLAGCEFGWVDLNGLVADGCEYACTFSGPEVCDGRDNDCNGLTDTADPGLSVPANFCNHTGECALGTDGQPTHPVCGIPPGPGSLQTMWYCNYRSTVQTTGPNQIIGEETLCDNLDNDCDGTVDESFPQKGQPCTDSGLGACQGRGNFVCAANRMSTVCNITSPGAQPTHEACDGIDNDCDGLTDESWDDPTGTRCGGVACRGVRDQVVHIQRMTGGQGYDFYIYGYEASRPDAAGSAMGSSTARACSRPGVMSWADVTYPQAQAACAAAGMRLCKVTRDGSGNVTRDEWGTTCGGPSSLTYPYGNIYQAATCDGRDYANPDAPVPTGSLPGCASAENAFDLSGDVAEWTDDFRGTTADGRAAYTLRGGGYDTIAQGLACRFDFEVVPLDFTFPDTGFRCCSLCAPGQAECAGLCRNLGTDGANCGACGHVCGAGTSCQNGVCR